MSTQVQEAHDMKIADWESTPVIIKTGGGPVDPPNILCTIDAKPQDFKSTLMDVSKWESAESVGTARITGLEPFENGKPLPPIEAESTGLVVLQITYGTDTLIVQEVDLEDSGLKKLAISSSLPFTAGGGQSEWTDSTGEVTPKAPFVVFTHGSNKWEHQFESTAVELRLVADWD